MNKENKIQRFDKMQQQAPAEEGARQYYFIEQARTLWKERFDALVDSGEAAGRYGSRLLGQLQGMQIAQTSVNLLVCIIPHGTGIIKDKICML